MKDILRLEPVLKEKVWGGSKLKEMFGYALPSNQTGECWGISGHENGTNKIVNGRYKGKTLRQLWNDHRELFNNQEGEEIPLLVKILDVQANISSQDAFEEQYSKGQTGYVLGPTECWYILDYEPDAELVLGHYAPSHGSQGKWEELFRHIPINRGDFVYVSSGMMHATAKGMVILEIQHSSDLANCFCDDDRSSPDRHLRPIHESSTNDSMLSDKDIILDKTSWEEDGVKVERLIQHNCFTVHKWTLERRAGSLKRLNSTYQLVTVIHGAGQIKTEESVHLIKKGDHFIIPSTVEYFELSGSITVIVSQTT